VEGGDKKTQEERTNASHTFLFMELAQGRGCVVRLTLTIEVACDDRPYLPPLLSMTLTPGTPHALRWVVCRSSPLLYLGAEKEVNSKTTPPPPDQRTGPLIIPNFFRLFRCLWLSRPIPTPTHPSALFPTTHAPTLPPSFPRG
jgi:hypothetical protein